MLMRNAALSALGLAFVPTLWLTACRHERVQSPVGEPWVTLDALYRHLLPADDDGPGAGQVGTLAYLRTTLPHSDTDKRDFLIGRIPALNAEARKQHGAGFAELSGTDREALLQALMSDSGWRRWLSRHVDIVLESLLADPVYGGNIDGAGWRWLAHQPGFPTPPADKRWYFLHDRRYFEPRPANNAICPSHG